MKHYLVRFIKNDSGATAIEYGLIAGIVSVAIIAAFGLFGGDLSALFEVISAEINPKDADG
ncbi:pilus assembly protein Flp/PilA [Roseinatronobacter thiooxidans]|uniref:Pilus assembly protein Flp/PilA n=1 Tax=Roseinatronobacter thiooxidans TaxID=121821 RepID=A0A2W7PX11_9RHOB|nr:Flp family type IVb pilin [Roseinatronobacter thiooxidans]PZX40688.1 pilus assembly protein Flp/PilA [Roseinatronobacter thiooxidans]